MHLEVREGQHALVGVGREAFARAHDVAHDPPAPFVGHVAHVAQEACEGEPAILLHRAGRRAPAEEMDFRAVFERGWRHCPSPRRRRPARRPSCREVHRSRSRRRPFARRSAGSARTKSGIHHSPLPSWPVASTTLRAARISPVDSVTSRQLPPSSSLPGAIAVAATSLRTGKSACGGPTANRRASPQSRSGAGRRRPGRHAAPRTRLGRSGWARLGQGRSGPSGCAGSAMRAKVDQIPSLPSTALSISRMLRTRSRSA